MTQGGALLEDRFRQVQHISMRTTMMAGLTMHTAATLDTIAQNRGTLAVAYGYVVEDTVFDEDEPSESIGLDTRSSRGSWRLPKRPWS